MFMSTVELDIYTWESMGIDPLMELLVEPLVAVRGTALGASIGHHLHCLKEQYVRNAR